jgi:hypothetical protein
LKDLVGVVGVVAVVLGGLTTAVAGGDAIVALFVLGAVAWVGGVLACVVYGVLKGILWVYKRHQRRLARPGFTSEEAAIVEKGISEWAIYVGFLLGLSAVIVYASTDKTEFLKDANDFWWFHVMAILLLAIAALALGARILEPWRSGSPRSQRCPDCAEVISIDARKCRFCGARLDPLDEANSWV